MLILTQFVFRLSFGLSVAMAVTPARLVTSGFYRVHLWVVMGLNTLGGLGVYSAPDTFPNRTLVLVLAVVTAVLSFVGSVVWLYERRRAGIAILYVIGLLSFVAAGLATEIPAETTSSGILLMSLDVISGGLLLGVTLAAMLLGHWYLNTPTMELVPLRRLVALMAAAIVVRTLLCAVGLSIHVGQEGPIETGLWIFLSLRWLSGLVGTMMLAWLAWLTLRVPNTQSATGILYAGVVLTFIGELTSKLLSVGELYPL